MDRRVLQRLIIIAVMLISGFASGQCAAQDAIGTVSRIQGEASGTRGGATRALALNAAVFLNEVVSTAETARLEVTFTDNTRLTLGEKAKLTLDAYVFRLGRGQGNDQVWSGRRLPLCVRPGVETGERGCQHDDAGRGRRHPRH